MELLSLLGFVVFREILNYLERKELTEKLMSRDIYEYYDAKTKVEQLKEKLKVPQELNL